MVGHMIYYPQVTLPILDKIITKTGSFSTLISKSMWYTVILLTRRWPCYSFIDCDMGMWFFGGGVGHKSTHAATDYFLRDYNHSDSGIDGQHDSIDNLIDYEDEVANSPIMEGSVLNGDNNYRYGDPLDKLEDVISDNPEDNDSRALEGSS